MSYQDFEDQYWTDYYEEDERVNMSSSEIRVINSMCREEYDKLRKNYKIDTRKRQTEEEITA